MRIAVITGSPHKNGTSASLADAFIEGAESRGHQVFRFDAAFEDINPCMACDICIENKGNCVHDDSIDKIRAKILKADLIVLVTPLYYFGISTQIKTVIDRFYAFNDELISSSKKSILLATGGDDYEWTMDAIELHYRTICRYLKWEISGMILAKGVYKKEDIEKSDYLNHARKLGASLIN
jgi:multimeric flavodoxin WrbA